MPMTFDIPKTNIELNYTMTSVPVINKEYIAMGISGEVEDKNKTIPFTNDCTLPEYDQTGLDIQTFISNYTLNSILYTLEADKLLKMDLTKIPAENGLESKIITTGMFRFFMGPLISKYGDKAPIRIHVYAKETPMV
jgi:hypothetical protein